MRITIAVGGFFLVLAIVFTVAARIDYLAALRQWTPSGKTRGRIAVVFATVGVGLLLWGILRG